MVLLSGIWPARIFSSPKALCRLVIVRFGDAVLSNGDNWFMTFDRMIAQVAIERQIMSDLCLQRHILILVVFVVFWRWDVAAILHSVIMCQYWRHNATLCKYSFGLVEIIYILKVLFWRNVHE